MKSLDLVVSFVHGYENLEINIAEKLRPALWKLDGSSKKIINVPFLRNPEDFNEQSRLITGSLPLVNASSFKKLPRFGLTGLSSFGNNLFAGSWNGVYQFDKNSLKLQTIITNPLMCDMHGIHVDSKGIYTVLTGKDTVVLTAFDGTIIDHFQICPDLNIKKDPNLCDIDWRFISKQFRGSTGHWHFNYIQIIDNELWLTSRNANCFVVINEKRNAARLEIMNFSTPVMLHDGLKIGNLHYLTSIDGKIIIAGKYDQIDFQEFRNNPKSLDLNKFEMGMLTKVFRLNASSLGREPNWCRGIEVVDDLIFVTIDGRYDSDLSFGLLMIQNEKIIWEKRLRWDEVGDEDELRFVTGFDVLNLN